MFIWAEHRMETQSQALSIRAISVAIRGRGVASSRGLGCQSCLGDMPPRIL